MVGKLIIESASATITMYHNHIGLRIAPVNFGNISFSPFYLCPNTGSMLIESEAET